MRGQRIQRTGKGKFTLDWLGVPNSTLYLDFNPIIDKYQLEGQFVLLHWQARPKNLRKWGVYNGATDHYFGFNAHEVKIEDVGSMELVEVDERIIHTVPTAMILLRDQTYFEGRILPWDQLQIL